MEKKTSKNIALTIIGALIIAELVTITCGLFLNRAPAYCWLNIATLLCIAAYGLYFYKKPHGNLIKYTMLLLAFTIAYSVCRSAAVYGEDFFGLMSRVVVAGATCYVAGRLDRIKQNRIILPIMLTILVVHYIIQIAELETRTFISVFSIGRNVIMYTTLMIAYFTRYKEHKEAGLIDAPKAK